MALPVVGTKDLHTVQLSPELRRILAKRASRAARRAYAPVLAADRQAFAIPRAEYRTQAGASKGATAATEQILASTLATLKGMGLGGSALQQTRSELSSRMGDVGQALPFLLAGAAEERTKGEREARLQLTQDQAAMQKSAASSFNSLLKEERDAGSSLLKSREEHQRSAEHDAALDPKNVENAEIALKTALTTWAENPEVKGPNGETIHIKDLNPLRTDQDWRTFAAGLVKQSEGFGLAEINAVIEELRPKAAAARQRREHEGVLPQPGVPGAGTWAAR